VRTPAAASSSSSSSALTKPEDDDGSHYYSGDAAGPANVDTLLELYLAKTAHKQQQQQEADSHPSPSTWARWATEAGAAAAEPYYEGVDGPYDQSDARE
jgi:hypothetical protein